MSSHCLPFLPRDLIHGWLPAGMCKAKRNIPWLMVDEVCPSHCWGTHYAFLSPGWNSTKCQRLKIAHCGSIYAVKTSKSFISDILFCLICWVLLRHPELQSLTKNTSSGWSDNRKKDRTCAFRDLCMSILPAQMHMHPECLVSTVARRRIPETEAIVWVSEPEPGASTGAASPIHCWATSPASAKLVLKYLRPSRKKNLNAPSSHWNQLSPT